MFFARRPTEREIDRFLQASRDLHLSYEPVGAASQRRPGFDFDEHVTVVGRGDTAYARAKAALAAWRHFELGWADALPRRDSARALAAAIGGPRTL